MYEDTKASWTGLIYPIECSFPTWRLERDHPACQALIAAHKAVFDVEPEASYWNFSTNGVAIMGRLGIPCVGFGPAHKEQAHAPNKITWKSHLVRCAAIYAAMPAVYLSNLRS